MFGFNSLIGQLFVPVFTYWKATKFTAYVDSKLWTAIITEELNYN